MASLEGVRVKRDRARAHFDAIEHEIKAFLGGNPCRTAIEPAQPQGRYLLRVHDVRPLPTHALAATIGDCVHNVRSALDYIAWELAGARLEDKETMFPIYDDEASFRRRGLTRIRNIPEGPRAVMESLQPYHDRPPEASALWHIARLDAMDKHKLLTATLTVPNEIVVSFAQGPPRGMSTLHVLEPYAPVREGAAIAEFTITPAPPTLELTPGVGLGVAFDYRAPDGTKMFVLPNLKIMLDSLDAVIAKFVPFF